MVHIERRDTDLEESRAVVGDRNLGSRNDILHIERPDTTPELEKDCSLELRGIPRCYILRKHHIARTDKDQEIHLRSLALERSHHVGSVDRYRKLRLHTDCLLHHVWGGLDRN